MGLRDRKKEQTRRRIAEAAHRLFGERGFEKVTVAAVARAAEVGASVLREGLDFGVVSRVPAVGGQVVSLQGLRARYDELFLPLYGAHQAQNASIALAAVEAFVGGGEQGEDRQGGEEEAHDGRTRETAFGWRRAALARTAQQERWRERRRVCL